MRTKKVATKRPAIRSIAKKAFLKKDIDYIHDGNPIVSKLLKLQYRINGAYRALPNGTESLREGYSELDTKSDKDFVIGLIHNIRKRDENPSKIQLEECNKIWSKYK